MNESKGWLCAACEMRIKPSLWLSHIFTKKHKTKSLVRNPSASELEKYVHVTGVDLDARDVAQNFLTFGLVINCDRVRGQKGTSPFYFVEFDTVDQAVTAVATGRHQIDGNTFYIRRRTANVFSATSCELDAIKENMMTSETPFHQIDNLISLIRVTDSEVTARQEFCAHLQGHLRQAFRAETEVLLFGSCVTRLGFRGADADIYVNYNFNEKDELTQEHQVRITANIIKKIPRASCIQPILKARVPIVKFSYPPLGIHVDISFRNEMSLRNSELILYYMSLDIRYWKMMMVLRWWAKKFGVTSAGSMRGGGCFTNYAFSWLVIFFLMQIERVPNVAWLQNGIEKLVEGWNCTFIPRNVGKQDSSYSILDLITRFFDYYSTFEFGLFAVCPLTGEPVNRLDLAKPEMLGPGFSLYKSACEKGASKIDQICAVCIQDPFELSYNVARGVSAKLSASFVAKCQEAARVCRLWFEEDALGGLYPLIYMALGDDAARKAVNSHFKVPFPRSVNASAWLPTMVFDISLDSCPLVNLCAQAGASSPEEYVKFWFDAVSEALGLVLSKFLFLTTWQFVPVPDQWSSLDEEKNVDELENFKPVFFCMLNAELQSAKLEAKNGLPAEASVAKNGLEKVLSPLPIVGRPVYGPIHRRSTRAKNLHAELLKNLTKFSMSPPLSSFFSEFKHPVMLRNSSQMNAKKSNPSLTLQEKEQYVSAHVLHTLREKEDFLTFEVPLRDLLVVITATANPRGVRVFLKEGSSVGSNVLFSASNFYGKANNVEKFLSTQLELLIRACLNDRERRAVPSNGTAREDDAEDGVEIPAENSEPNRKEAEVDHLRSDGGPGDENEEMRFNLSALTVRKVMEISHSCETFGCDAVANMQCPTCLKLNLKSAFFCSQECFKRSWSVHKLVHRTKTVTAYDPWPGFTFSGKLRPAKLSMRRDVPDNIPRPDYALHPEGISFSEQHSKGKQIVVLDDVKKEALAVACKLGREVLDEAVNAVEVGVTSDEIDRIVHEACVDRECYPSPLNYYQFPKSCCTSINEVICHGIPDVRPLHDGDILNIDVTVFHRGFHGDLNETLFVGNVSDTAKKLVQVTWECLEKAIAIVKPGEKYREVGNVIQKHAQHHGFSVVRAYCGHGIHELFHTAPSVPHYAKSRAMGTMKPGHSFTIEPMICEGTWKDMLWPDNWTAVTLDGKLSAQFEQTLIVTDTGCEILTKRLERNGQPYFMDSI
ncbi:unnamed protein product [Notodromas monacha]|uniref:Methionine aminopeptidase n=1 Tax=Notodromas monacha TaxID=399045 RepID=A0A7R9BGV7_9CRUS|nr:unnamed protein product [Notodromas monacha]CAG0913645.1 unnamed protein product [Notodromas monacha]